MTVDDNHISRTETPAMIRPSVSASARGTAPDGIGRVDVRVITASMSASYHMFIAPAAPEPSAIANKDIAAITGFIVTPVTDCAATRPAMAVNATNMMIRGFSSST